MGIDMHIETAKAKFGRLVKKGQSFERAWDKAVLMGDEAKMAELNQQAETFYASWEKYERMGLMAQMVGDKVIILETTIVASQVG